MKLQRSDVSELHCIVPMANVPSIASRGILSHHLAETVEHSSVAAEEVQARRAKVKVPGGLRLHEYANLYIDARNAMMYKVVHTHDHREVCVLRVSTSVLDLPGVVIADRNAAADFVRFGPSPGGLAMIDRELVFAEWWSGSNEAKSVRCAEILVPNSVAPDFIEGAYVSCDEALHQFEVLKLTERHIPAIISEHLFYR